MTMRFWIVGGEYRDSDFQVLVPGKERLSGPFEDERKARTEWTRLSRRPECSATTRYSIVREMLR